MVEYRAAKEAYDDEFAAYEPVKAAWNAEKKGLRQGARQLEVGEGEAQAGPREARRGSVPAERDPGPLGRGGRDARLLGKAMAKTQYAAMLGKVSRPPSPVNGSLAPYQEQPHFEFDDIVALIRIAPGGFDTKKASADRSARAPRLRPGPQR